jgi:hypothetical protein
VSLHRGIDGSGPVDPEPVGRLAGPQEERRNERPWRMAVGTLACPACDAPVAPTGTLRPAEPLVCPFCAHAGAVRDFLSLTAPTRPARVEVRVVARPRWAARRPA